MKLNPLYRYSSSPFTNLKVWPISTVLVCLFLPFASEVIPAQEPAPAQEPNYDFVSGIITELSSGRIVVNRPVVGKPAENRIFLITSETKVEGTLREGARVTVGFKPTEEGDVAMRIIVRPAQAK
jgi:hypothetical protein